MKIDSLILDSKDVYSMLSKTEPSLLCVFIAPSGIVDAGEAIYKFKLNCTSGDLYSEKLLMEMFDDSETAKARVKQFSNVECQNYFYVCCYKNGKLFCENI